MKFFDMLHFLLNVQILLLTILHVFLVVNIGIIKLIMFSVYYLFCLLHIYNNVLQIGPSEVRMPALAT